MGYPTELHGAFAISIPPVQDDHTEEEQQKHRSLLAARLAYMKRFTEDCCHVEYLVDKETAESKACREAAGLPLMPRFILDGPAADDNQLSLGSPSYYCQWNIVQSEDGSYALIWDGNEKFYCYFQWLRILILIFFREFKWKLTGEVTWQGEQRNDTGIIRVVNNKMEVIDNRKKRQSRKKAVFSESDLTILNDVKQSLEKSSLANPERESFFTFSRKRKGCE